MPKTAFFAYPAEPKFIGDTILESIPNAREKHGLIIMAQIKDNRFEVG
jgi:hypothetical protein